jgi:hypothetical protein
MKRLAADLASTGELRSDVHPGEAADIIWATNSAEFYDQVRQRGWQPQHFKRWLASTWTKLLIGDRPKVP